MKAPGKHLLWLLLVPPGAAIAMGVLMLSLALDTDPGVIEPSTVPLSKTSWRTAPEQSEPPSPAP